ncbi:hypothetical protein A2715_05150 [Candidatus Woesebacteria bacterium RIFCSPHIGHO2_01_FULL_39_32]|uniref:Glycosyl transferase family 1 domain-containing protein n=1 Tax=Candidatus Woesebacteria bacterium RIFCSPLOWO2_01_FULL_39_25 TaxID=1802521 RepID=A0A1F8BLJ6_9BACT|nr:MAG: hypothetical protein A2124_05155 [Candidatus Woesebacteria bacterium GWB1_37_5]OGM25405.1 MAG: hypothetical protein A2715_05150 [Candidatus Woesebacteria bacterium RIFCSPHIGHO2_01_FULL_39_32]OGM38511.1 MAG: hypothetical protein A3F01_04110 [Candidatus Woesebacteria bacterium RIFCSPHIGHO2_12_FULL_38_11]OGM64936.1 MAG: hypothetical protein A2893_04760 [Candidatus Woesebacteria bacterium RIFCSPLOWO2_01_FULL_39_25]
MKILIDARMYGLEHSGIGRYLINLIDNLKEIDRENSYIILLRKKYFDELRFPENWMKIIVDLRHYTFAEQFKLPGIINKEKPDLVHFPHFNIPLQFKGPFVVTIHDTTMHHQGTNATTLPLYKYIFKRIPYKLVFKKAVINSKKIITPSETVKKEVLDYYKVDPEKIAVAYEGFNADYIVEKASSRELETLTKFKAANADYFFYVGNAYPHKNLDNVIRGIVDINKNKNGSVRFLIAGSRDIFMERLQKLIDRLEANDYVELLGFVRDDELWVLYKYSLGFVYPSLSEGFGLQGLEAISSGTILLASNIPVFQEIYGSHAFYFNPQDVSSISGTMYSVLKMEREDKYKYLEIAQEYIKKYSWQKMAKETLEVYRQVLKEK